MALVKVFMPVTLIRIDIYGDVSLGLFASNDLLVTSDALLAEINHSSGAGYEPIEIPVQYKARLGEKKLKLRHGLAIFKITIAESLKLNS